MSLLTRIIVVTLHGSSLRAAHRKVPGTVPPEDEASRMPAA